MRKAQLRGLRACEKMAKKSVVGKSRHGACVMDGKRVISQACNAYCSPDILKRFLR